jgi:hypothetical protein
MMPMAMMVPSMMVFIIVIAWLAIRIDIARIDIVIGWWHNDHAWDTDVNIDPALAGTAHTPTANKASMAVMTTRVMQISFGDA